MNARRWIPITLILLAALSVGGALAFSPFVRSQAQSRADPYNLSLQINSVRPALFGVKLNDVHVAIPDIPSLSLHLESVRVEKNAISVEGGTATIQTSREQFTKELSLWRSKLRSSQTADSPTHKSIEIALRDIQLRWPEIDGPSSRLELDGLRVDDLFDSRTISATKVTLEHPRLKVNGDDLTLEWTSKQPLRVKSLKGRHLWAEIRLGSAASPQEAKPSESEKAPTNAHNVKEKPTEALRDRLSRLAKLAWSPLAQDASLEIDAFEVLLYRDAEKINVGPGVLAAQNKGDTVLIDLTPGVEHGKKGISFRASVPIGEGPVVMDVVGGPISLATLGVKDTNLGLVKVADTQLTADAHVKLHADGKNLSFDGKVEAKNLSLKHERLAPGPVEGLELAARGRGQLSLDGSFVRFDEGSVDVGKVQLQLRGTIDRSRPKMRVDLNFGIPLVGCQDFLDALPEKLIPVVHGMRAAGTLSLNGHIRFDEESFKDFLLEYAASNDCRITSVSRKVDVKNFELPFSRTVYDSRGKAVQIDAGPGTPGWITSGGVSRFMEAAIMTSEDGRFRRHRGFDHEAIQNSVRENLKAGKFLRGASTISMQLAKNLYLSRDKTISRKLQELILTAYLEQALTKDQIMTLYLNVIEFGPMTYGVGNAASKYFSKHPASLSLGQAMYLASILPSPSHQHFAQGGRVSDGWMRYLYKLMKIAAKMRWITEVDLEYGLGEWVVYGSPDPVRVGPDPSAGIDGEVGTDGVLRPEAEEPFGWMPSEEPAY